MTGFGPTTGSCAAAAAKAAALHGLGRRVPRELEVPSPAGDERLSISILSWGGRPNSSWACVRKPVTDDPDATRGAVVGVSLRRSEALRFRAGAGVGIVSRPGLQLPPGEPAINPGPRAQIAAVLREAGRDSWDVTISVHGGDAIARGTFNPRLGIEGGISILGSTGFVRPWSLEALVASIDAHMGVVRARGQDVLLLVPGHMGERAARTLLPEMEAVEAGNAWGDVLERASGRDFRAVVAVGHPGKLVKLAQGQWDTHSSAGSTAARWAFRLLRRRLDTEAHATLVPSDTLEGLLVPLPEEARRVASDLLAARVARAIGRRAGLPARVLLVDLKGNLLGEGSV